jgi:hypothetical protein
VAGWVVDSYLKKAGGFAALVPCDTPLRSVLLIEAASVLRDAYTQIAADFHGQSHKPTLRSASLKTKSETEVSAGDNLPLSPEGRLSLAKYWDVHLATKQASSAPVSDHTLERRWSAWKELCDLLGPESALFKVTKADIWRYRDELMAAPARAGSSKALRDLSFPQRIEAARLHPGKFKNLDLNSIGDRLRQVNAVFAMAVARGHLVSRRRDYDGLV